MVIEDSQCDAKEGLTAFKKLTEIEGVSVVIGVVCSNVANAIGPVANEEGIPVMLSVASAYESTEENDYVFKFWPSDDERASFEAMFLAEELGFEKIAVVYENNARSSGLAKMFEKKATMLGTTVYSEAFEPDSTDFKTVVLKLKEFEPEAVFIFAYEQPTLNFLKQSKELGFETRFFATSTVLSQSFIESLGGIAEGTVIDLPIARGLRASEFEQRFYERFNDSIIHPGSYFAYDSLMVLAEILNKTQERTKIRDRLYSIESEGISGYIEFDSWGQNMEKKKFGLLEIRGGEFLPFEG